MPPTAHEGLDRFLKSAAFSVLCFVIWAVLGVPRILALIKNPSIMEAVWVLYHTQIALLFLIRSRPSYVSTKPIHWLIALIASFSGFFFASTPTAGPSANVVGDALILIGLLGSGLSGLALQRRYDFLPALRGVSTGSVYAYVRHPMYLFALVIRVGYVLKHPSLYNLGTYLVLVGLYAVRARFEEQIMLRDPRYEDYMARVRWRFVPGVY